ncbi:MAG: hypothetical protein WCO55_02140 [Candidatus Falkowbacteria bacterium]
MTRLSRFSILLSILLFYTTPALAQSGSAGGIGNYIVSLYQFGMSAIGVLAVLGVAIGGMMWVLSMGNPAKVTKAKAWIQDSLYGLSVGLCAYLILGMINKDLLLFKSLDVSYIDRQETILKDVYINDTQGGDANGRSFNNNSATPPNVFCPKTGGSAVISQVAASFNGVMAYDETMRTLPIASRPGKFWYDCSSYASKVLYCSGLSNPYGQNTASIFSNCNEITSCRYENGQLYLNNQQMQPGTLWGYPGRLNRNMPSDGSVASGHVLVYTGGTATMDCNGSGKGEDGNCWGHYNDTCLTISVFQRSKTVCYQPAVN